MTEIKRVTEKANGTADEVTSKIVNAMWRLSNRDSKAQSIIKRASSLKGRNKTETIKNIYSYLIAKVPYVKDPDGYELIKAPIHLESGEIKGGDCDCMVTYLSSLLSAVGIKSRICTLSWRIPQFSHVFLEAHNGWTWKVLDPTRGTDGYGSTIPEEMDQVKRRIIKYGKTMDIVTLEDCGCNSNPLADCGCGGKCGGGKKHRATNHNNNVTNVNIGNEVAEALNLRMNSNQSHLAAKGFGGNVAPIIDKETGESRRLILQQKPKGFRQVKTTYTTPTGAWY